MCCFDFCTNYWCDGNHRRITKYFNSLAEWIQIRNPRRITIAILHAKRLTAAESGPIQKIKPTWKWSGGLTQHCFIPKRTRSSHSVNASETLYWEWRHTRYLLALRSRKARRRVTTCCMFMSHSNKWRSKFLLSRNLCHVSLRRWASLSQALSDLGLDFLSPKFRLKHQDLLEDAKAQTLRR